MRSVFGVSLVIVLFNPTSAAAEPAPPFEGRTRVRYEELVAEVRRVADSLQAAPDVQKGYRTLLADYQLTERDLTIESYSRVRLVFEATRDGGLWGVRWKITDREPRSDYIWKQWRERDFSGALPELTAEAECDELSALFSVLARDVGIQGFVGLFWPTWNHTVAVWQLERGAQQGKRTETVRLVVPTSQVRLSRDASLGTRGFKADRTVYPYARRDVKSNSELPAPLARFLIDRLEQFAALSNEELVARRNRLGGS